MKRQSIGFQIGIQLRLKRVLKETGSRGVGVHSVRLRLRLVCCQFGDWIGGFDRRWRIGGEKEREHAFIVGVGHMFERRRGGSKLASFDTSELESFH